MSIFKKSELAGHYAYRHLLQRLSLWTNTGFSKPSMLCGLVNWQCNFKCDFCLHPYYKSRPVLTFKEWERTLSDLKKWLKSFRFNFLGGEPFLREDFIDILGVSRSLNIMTGVTTNGSLITAEIANKLGMLDLFSIGVSVDGISAETHEKVRGCPGQYRKIINGLIYLQNSCKSSTSIIVRTIIMKDNIDELVQLVKLVKELKLSGIIFQPLDPQPVIDGKPPNCEMLPFDFSLWLAEYKSHQVTDFENLDECIMELISLKRSGAPIVNSETSLLTIKHQMLDEKSRKRSRCPVGVQNLMILPNGDVHTCCDTVNFGPLGNVIHSTPKEVWQTTHAKHQRELTRNCDRNCLFFSHARRSIWENAQMFMKYVNE